MVTSLAEFRTKRQARKTLQQVDDALYAPNPISEVAKILEMDVKALGIETFEEFVQVVQVRCFDLNRLIDPDFVPRCPTPVPAYYDDPA